MWLHFLIMVRLVFVICSQDIQKLIMFNLLIHYYSHRSNYLLLESFVLQVIIFLGTTTFPTLLELMY